MTPTLPSIRQLSDHDLLAQLDRVAGEERRATAHLVALLMEVESRKLYAAQGCSSLFAYCVQVLRFSEHAAYLRIEAARAARRFPVIAERLASGSLHLTAVSLLAPHLTDLNLVTVLEAAHHKSKREVEQLVAGLRPQHDVPSVLRKLPAPISASTPQPSSDDEERQAEGSAGRLKNVCAPHTSVAEVKPLAPERFKVQFTVGRDTYEKLRRAQDLLRHAIPNGDPAAIFDRALTLLLVELSKTKFAAATRPRSTPSKTSSSRHIPAAVKRAVWDRDGGQCAFPSERGRCAETGFLEFHHVLPYAKGGTATVDNVELRCRAHNLYEAERHFPHMTNLFRAREGREVVHRVSSVRTECSILCISSGSRSVDCFRLAVEIGSPSPRVELSYRGA
jgi:hypothetical protein